jgi:hypothetical protein
MFSLTTLISLFSDAKMRAVSSNDNVYSVSRANLTVVGLFCSLNQVKLIGLQGFS